jgi:Mat/Ecp fimbriae major subunit
VDAVGHSKPAFVTKDQFMLNKKIALLGAAAIAMVSTGANAATQTATAEVDIIAAVTLTQNAGLDFGVVATSATSGTVIMPTTTDTRSCSAGVTCAAGTARRGQFTVSNATSGYLVNIVVPPSTTLNFSGNTMNLVLLPSMTAFTSTGADQVFYVGGTLSVNANQPAGTYTGTYSVSADYQ